MLKCFLRVLMWGLSGVAAWAGDVEQRVVVLANSDEPESVRLAEYYAEKRGVPKGNIIALPMPLAESVNWRTFVDAVFNPLQAELVKRDWIDAIGMELADTAGRKKYAMSGHNISYLVVCRGVPLKVVNDPKLPEENLPAAANKAFKTNAASVDGELALLAVSNPPLAAFVPNPLFKKDAPSALELQQIVKVGRLDGPTFGDARRLVDQALEAERTGLIGRAYVDIGGPHKTGDTWLEDTVKELEPLDYDMEVDRGRGSLGEWARMDGAALYFGWYAGAVNGPFLREGFTFPPGAVALHIHSYSANTLRSTTRGWVGPLVARGVTATFGNVTEPYLELTHQPHLVLKALARGDRLGDAAAYSVPVYSWQAMAVGDPLYRPFKVTAEAQWAMRETLSPERRVYVVLRRMRELDRAGRRNDAIGIGREAQKEAFNLVVAVTLVDLQLKAGDTAGARAALEAATTRRRFAEEEAPVAAVVAQRLLEMKDAKAAVGVWYAVLGGRDLPKDVRVRWLKAALAAARAAKDARQAVRWDEELAALTAPLPPKTTE